MPVLLIAPVWMRFSVVGSIHFFPPAKKEGLAYFFSRDKKGSSFYYGLMFLLVTIGLIRWQWMIFLLPAFGLTFALGRTLTRRFGGMTGDLFGLTAYVAEILFLTLCAAGQAAGI